VRLRSLCSTKNRNNRPNHIGQYLTNKARANNNSLQIRVSSNVRNFGKKEEFLSLNSLQLKPSKSAENHGLESL